MQALVKNSTQKSAQRTVSSYLTIVDGNKQKLCSLKEFVKYFHHKQAKKIFFFFLIFVFVYNKKIFFFNYFYF